MAGARLRLPPLSVLEAEEEEAFLRFEDALLAQERHADLVELRQMNLDLKAAYNQLRIIHNNLYLKYDESGCPRERDEIRAKKKEVSAQFLMKNTSLREKKSSTGRR